MANRESHRIFRETLILDLAAQVVDYLKVALGQGHESSSSATARIAVEVQENVRGRDVFIIQPTCAPSHKNLMELLLLID